MSKMMSLLLLLSVVGVKKKRDKIKIDAFRKTLTIPESEISEGPEQEVKLKIGNIKENIW